MSFKDKLQYDIHRIETEGKTNVIYGVERILYYNTKNIISLLNITDKILESKKCNNTYIVDKVDMDTLKKIRQALEDEYNE